MRRAPSLMLLLVLAVAAPAADLLAATPPDFRRTQVFFHPTLQSRHFLGPLADSVGWSVGLGVTQGVQFGYWALSVTLETDYFLTEQQPPPFDTGLQIGGIHAAVRYFQPFQDFRPFVEVGYRYMGVVSNAVVSETGPDLSFNALTAGAGLRLTHPAPLYIELRGSWDWLLDLDETSVVGVSLSIGIRSIL